MSGYELQNLEPALHTIVEQAQAECRVSGLLNSAKRI
jgi:hypothetical protein